MTLPWTSWRCWMASSLRSTSRAPTHIVLSDTILRNYLDISLQIRKALTWTSSGQGWSNPPLRTIRKNTLMLTARVRTELFTLIILQSSCIHGRTDENILPHCFFSCVASVCSFPYLIVQCSDLKKMKTRGFKVLFASELHEQKWTNTALLHYGSVVQCMCKNDKKPKNSFHVKCTCRYLILSAALHSG